MKDRLILDIIEFGIWIVFNAFMAFVAIRYVRKNDS